MFSNEGQQTTTWQRVGNFWRKDETPQVPEKTFRLWPVSEKEIEKKKKGKLKRVET